MTDNIENFISGKAAVEQCAKGAGYRRGMNQVFNLAAALQARGIDFGSITGEQNQ